MTEAGVGDFEQVFASGFLQGLVDGGRLVPLERVDAAGLDGVPAGTRILLRHPRLSMISYPYEWPFAALKAAALLHLDIQLEALDGNIVLSDSSAYNVQFRGWRPIFIDHLSFRPYRDGEIWSGHRQFLDQFLNPLLLRAILGIAHNAWYRGAPEGIPTADINRMLPLRRKFSISILTHVTLPARLQAGAGSGRNVSLGALRDVKLPRSSYRGILSRLRGWVAGLKPRDTQKTTWRDYQDFRTYDSDALAKKQSFVAEFVRATKPRQLLDFGCNTGEFAELALGAGCAEVIGFDSDHGALERAYGRARDKDLRFLPLFLDATNPSPGQGWNGAERKPLDTRCKADAVTALAFIHHLAIARNIPLRQVISWLVGLAPQGVIEFVPKQDETVRLLLQLREDIFPDYTEENFLRILSSQASVLRSQRVTESGRLMVWYRRGG